MNALAVAPDPELLIILTAGSVIYPDPPSTIFISVTTKPTLSNQCFHGYEIIALLLAVISPSITLVTMFDNWPFSNTGGTSKSVTDNSAVSIFVYPLMYSLIFVL